MFSKNSHIIGLFVILSVISCLILVSSGMVGGAFDLQFNWQRIYELRSSIAHFNFFPKLALNQFNQDGSAVMTLYPYFNLFPAAILSFIIPFVPLVYILFFFHTFASLLISYLASYKLKHNKKISFLFSISYSMSTLMVTYYFHNMDFGVSSVMMFLPLVIFGFIELLEKNKWLELSIGMTLLGLSHILSLLMLIVLLIIWGIINFNKFINDGKLDLSKLSSLGKATALTLFATARFWIPFLDLWTKNNINPPMNFGLGATTSFDKLIINAISGSTLEYSITFISLLGLILGIVTYRSLEKYTKQMFWISVVTIIMGSGLFPWGLLANTPLNVIQFPWRIYIIPQLLLCYIFSTSIFILIKNSQKQKITLLGLGILILAFQLVAQMNIVNEYKNYPELTQPYAENTTVKLPVINGEIAYRISNSNDFKNIINSQELDKDYYPTSSLVWYSNIVNHQAPFDVTRFLSTNLLGNGKYEFNNNVNKVINELNLPFFAYNGIRYSVKLDGKIIPSHQNATKLLTINNVPEGKHTLQVIVHEDFLDIFSLIISLIGFLCYCYLFALLMGQRDLSKFLPKIKFLSFLKNKK